MSWNHSICFDCWSRQDGNMTSDGIKVPVRVKDHEPEQCCFCRRLTIDGIFVRRDPDKMSCKHESE